MPTPDGLTAAIELMTRSGVHPSAIAVFAHSYQVLAAGETGMLAESDLEPIRSLPALADLDSDEAAARQALSRTAVIKLNGGLGTSMGMDRAKSLVRVRGDRSFLDLIVEQVRTVRAAYGVELHIPTCRFPEFRWISCRTENPSFEPTICSR